MNTATATKAAPIAWQPLAHMPDDRKDGRDLLVWSRGFPAIASWLNGWRDAVGNIVPDVTSYADVEGPGQ